MSFRITVNLLILTCVLYGTLYLIGSRLRLRRKSATPFIDVGSLHSPCFPKGLHCYLPIRVGLFNPPCIRVILPPLFCDYESSFALSTETSFT